MTVPVQSLLFADPREAADLAAFLGRLLHYDRAAAVRLQAGGGDALAVFGRPPSFEVLAIRTARLARPETLDVTVSAGELLESLDVSGDGEGPGERGGALPAPVTGPPWTGVLPPRGPWQEQAGLPAPDALRVALDEAVAEFRTRDEALPEESRTRAERDRIGREIWSRPVGTTDLPLRAVHAAQSLGFLRPDPDFPVSLLSAGGWLRLRTPFGSIALRRDPAGGLGGLGLSVEPG
ncbi:MULTISPECIES: hypothetical protein [Streptomyces]|uniref:FAD-binding PCMH-type domain-containing protein n=1 Tax=Streptomyces rubiginosohelvolus TaxID=67362 RepID=A0ABQ3CBB5_9ACTN|nr:MULTISPECIES: hypothetical protein [Streptomyces]WST53346.1 hypothetical protein OG475_10915 [Streptomyces rubiginosohelvolus]GGR90374.1 hypothetical protein GCM10010284_24370 [Streptomyces rubiginosohelvolus]GGZ73953.1 hypothetical protein GCM10010328_56180 [Streptomyces pluricolorescens]